jgi:hypothetical protein
MNGKCVFGQKAAGIAIVELQNSATRCDGRQSPDRPPSSLRGSEVREFARGGTVAVGGYNEGVRYSTVVK